MIYTFLQQLQMQYPKKKLAYFCKYNLQRMQQNNQVAENSGASRNFSL